MTHIYVSKLVIIGSDNGLSPSRRQSIIRTNAGRMLIQTLGTNFNENYLRFTVSLQRRHYEHDDISNHQPHDCLLTRLFRRRSKKHQSPASLAFVCRIQRWPVNSPHKGPVTRKMFPYDDVIMMTRGLKCGYNVPKVFVRNDLHWHITECIQRTTE